MRKLIIEIPDDLHSELRKRAATEQKTLKSIITKLVHSYLLEPGEQVQTKKGTGLCGIWEDGRSAEEIIKDIKSHREWFSRKRADK